MSAQDISREAIDRVLAGEGRYDDLTGVEQAIYRIEYQRLVEERLRTLDLKAQFEAPGRSYVELDEAGNVIIRRPR